MLLNIRHHVDGIEAGASQSNQVTQLREEEEADLAGRNIHEEYTDKSEEEENHA